MSYKVARKSFKGDMLLLQKDGDNGKGDWFFLTPEVQRFAKGFNTGDVLSDIVVENQADKKFITRITANGKPQEKPPYQKKSYTPTNGSATTDKKPWGAKSPEESEKIARLSILSSTTNVVATMGIKDPQEVVNAVKFIYEELHALVSQPIVLPQTEVVV